MRYFMVFVIVPMTIIAAFADGLDHVAEQTVTDSDRGIEFIGADGLTKMIVPRDSALATNVLARAAAVIRSAERQAQIEKAERVAVMKQKYGMMWTQIKTVLNANGFTITNPESFVEKYPEIIEWAISTSALTATQKQQALARLPALYFAIKDNFVD